MIVSKVCLTQDKAGPKVDFLTLNFLHKALGWRAISRWLLVTADDHCFSLSKIILLPKAESHGRQTNLSFNVKALKGPLTDLLPQQ